MNLGTDLKIDAILTDPKKPDLTQLTPSNHVEENTFDTYGEHLVERQNYAVEKLKEISKLNTALRSAIGAVSSSAVLSNQDEIEKLYRMRMTQEYVQKVTSAVTKTIIPARETLYVTLVENLTEIRDSKNNYDTARRTYRDDIVNFRSLQDRCRLVQKFIDAVEAYIKSQMKGLKTMKKIEEHREICIEFMSGTRKEPNTTWLEKFKNTVSPTDLK